MSDLQFSPGNLVSARGREWIVLSGSTDDVLRLRPLSGGPEDEAWIHLGLEPEPVGPATFPPPGLHQRGSHDDAMLLRDALLLSLRRGAGPFRSFGNLAVQPRAYQLVPLLMALRQETVRLLIADDVGLGKTIEAGLIAREMFDRGELERLTVLCPPHLVEQWVQELQRGFHLQAVAVTAAGAARLERHLPPGTSLFDAHPFTVVSLDYIKADKRRDHFRTHCPRWVIVDEAHTCASAGQGRHQRYELLRALADDPGRNMLFLTATPHSGDVAAFGRLLGLIDRKFEAFDTAEGNTRRELREQLASFLVQRRRPDIDEWREQRLFPRRESSEVLYHLTGPWERFFQQVLAYCRDVVSAAGDDQTRRRMNFWGTLAILRCASSSPAAAVQALRTTAGLDDESSRSEWVAQLFDGDEDDAVVDDVEPASETTNPALTALVKAATELAQTKGDPKAQLLVKQVRALLEEGFSPVIFCRYISTAWWLERHLTDALNNVHVAVVTGQIASSERERIVAELSDMTGPRVLVATDCLSEGVNLQRAFDAVVHYDLSWNPTRHEQREGRVDRFGQPNSRVRAVLMVGADNPIDDVVVRVILKKARQIKAALGVPVPVPAENRALTVDLMQWIIEQDPRNAKQGRLALEDTAPAQKLEQKWVDALAHANASRTVFAQRSLRPAEVLPELERTLVAIGGHEDVQRFVERAFMRMGSPLQRLTYGFRASLATLPIETRERLEVEGMSDSLVMRFDTVGSGSAIPVERSHPLVSVLAESVLERALSAGAADEHDPTAIGRLGCWVSGAVNVVTVVALLRIRHQIIRRGKAPLLVEEATAIAWCGADRTLQSDSEAVLRLLSEPPAADVPAPIRQQRSAAALALLDQRSEDLQTVAQQRARQLLIDHERTRASARAQASIAARVQPMLPPDVMGLFVLLPRMN